MERFKGLIAAFMGLSLLSPSVPVSAAQAAPSSPGGQRAPARRPYQSGQLQGDERILHALNRFTFGPRPGDLEAVKAMGLERWFEQQLHPATLDEADLDARLAQFPAMQWDTPNLLFRLPSYAVIRQVADGKVPMPENRALQAIYQN